MDDLNSKFGQLSTTAAEWKPKGASQRDSPQDSSELNPSAVKEFVPGKGWASNGEKVSGQEDGC